ncbi:MAG: hypothetical protein ACSHW7_11715 [Patiriisocius sp.]|uniref:hypothetical protein n=1 Tax=Patiriisocius sp. TaxID=2822396 RepID=UPI003EF1AA38
MKLKLIVTIYALVFLSCGQDKQEQLENLSGYWEIVSVEDEDGTLKEFKISTTVDYISVENSSGKRAKVKPQLDGTFITSGNVEEFEIMDLPEHIALKYKTPYATWSEFILDATKEKLVILNEEGKKYTYKRFSTFTFE